MSRMPSVGRIPRQVSRTGASVRSTPSTAPTARAGEVTMTLTGPLQPIVVPKGIYRMSVVMVTQGSPGWCCDNTSVCPPIYCSGPGPGGALGYSNCMPVIPGETLTTQGNGGTVTLTRKSTGQVVMRVNMTKAPTDVAQVRFSGEMNYRETGGYVGDASNAATQDHAQGISGKGVALYGRGVGGRSSPSGFGSAPSCMPLGQVTFYGASGIYGGNAGPAGIRLIWGSGRSFPYHARKITA